MNLRSSTIEDLMKLPTNHTIFTVSNTETKECMFFVSSNILRRLTDIIQSVKHNTHKEKEFYKNFEKLEIKILETLDDELTLKIFTKYHKDKLLAQGYKILNNKVYIRPFIRTTIGTDQNKKKRIFVEIASHDGRTRQVVGIFNYRSEAQEFVKHCYPGKPYFPVIAYNDLTRDYILWFNNLPQIKYGVSF